MKAQVRAEKNIVVCMSTFLHSNTSFNKTILFRFNFQVKDKIDDNLLHCIVQKITHHSFCIALFLKNKILYMRERKKRTENCSASV